MDSLLFYICSVWFYVLIVIIAVIGPTGSVYDEWMHELMNEYNIQTIWLSTQDDATKQLKLKIVQLERTAIVILTSHIKVIRKFHS